MTHRTKSANLRRAAILAGVVVGLLLGILMLAGCAKEESGAVKYHCPMHPTYVSDRPGDCPICGMRLVPIAGDRGRPASPAATPGQAPSSPSASSGPDAASPAQIGASPTAAPGQIYACPMHPEVTSTNPADKCPKCGMALEPISRDDKATSGVAETPSGYSPVELDARGLALAGVQTAPAVREVVGRAIRAVGVVKPDERLVRHVHTKISGWVEHLHVNFTGQAVRAGEPILSIYSPDLLATQQEFVRAREAAERFRASEFAEVREGAEDLIRVARRRLELLDVPPAQISELERTGQPQRVVTLTAPSSGFVASKATFEGQEVQPGMELFTVADLARVWVEADIYEFEASAVRVGQPAVVTSPYNPRLRREGKVAYVYPFLDPESRTLKVRFDFTNPALELKPEMFVNVEMNLDAAPSLTVPDSAIIDSGVRRIVFIDKGGGRFEPREVTVGARSSGRAQVLAGLAEGERVAVRANFLLDSESRLRAAIAGAAPAGAHQHEGGAP